MERRARPPVPAVIASIERRQTSVKRAAQRRVRIADEVTRMQCYGYEKPASDALTGTTTHMNRRFSKNNQASSALGAHRMIVNLLSWASRPRDSHGLNLAQPHS